MPDTPASLATELQALATRVAALPVVPPVIAPASTKPTTTLGMPPPGTGRFTDLTVTVNDFVIVGVRFTRCRINVSGSARGRIINCTFDDCPVNGDNGSAIALSDANDIQIINCDFNRVAGSTLGNYNMTKIVVNGCHFIDCNQPASYSCWTGGDTCQFINCYFSGCVRGGIESGGDLQMFKDFLVQGCTFVNNKAPAAIGPISFVARGVVTGTRIVDNYFELGPNGDRNVTPIEAMVGVTATGNTFVDFPAGSFMLWDGSPGPISGPTARISGNKVYNTPDSWDSTVLATRPTAPMPPRFVW